ncbi:MAG TPA: Asd/ArgC dimerization domain-containing protein [Bryobacteraceae bacterium]|nr:Asd/ArgC dimerization domain-containing protein [Bryobacteraceae bacterium]
MPKPQESIISIVGSESLLGRELRDQIADRKIQGRVQLIGSDDKVTGILSAQAEEAVVLTALDADRLQNSDIVFLAGSVESSHRALGMLAEGKPGPTFIDLTGGLEDQPNGRLRSPFTEPDGYFVPPGSIHIIAHPAAMVLSLVLARIQKQFPIEQSVVHILEPASERGQAGINELQQQTASLLAFKPLNKEVFDAQASFNVLPRYGSEAPERLEDIEQKIDRHSATLLGMANEIPLPSLRLVQAPVFHGHSFSFWIRFREAASASGVSEALASAQIEVRAADLDPPSNVGSVGQSGVTTGLIEPDRNDPKAIWMWAVADNFHITVENAIEVGRTLLQERGA